jgi:hypothetical protein
VVDRPRLKRHSFGFAGPALLPNCRAARVFAQSW